MVNHLVAHVHELRLGHLQLAAAVQHLDDQQQHSQDGQAVLGEQVARHSAQLQGQDRALHMHGENFRFIAQV